MMRRIELLPESYQAQRRQRRNISLIIAGGVVVLTLLLGYWLVLGMRIASSEDELARATADNADLRAEIDSLQRFAHLETQVNNKQAALATVMQSDVDWPAVLTEVAMVVPGEVWLTNLTASAGQTEGATAVGTETAPVRVGTAQPFGRIQFQGNSLTMPGVAKWLLRLGTAEEFEALWLNDATETELGTSKVVGFDSTLELSGKAASGRFQDELQP
jgi:Tfp pilus assembly protein PilN